MNTDDVPPHGPYSPRVHVRFFVKSCCRQIQWHQSPFGRDRRTFSSLILDCTRVSSFAITDVISACNDCASRSLSSPPRPRLSLLPALPRSLDLELDALPLFVPLPLPLLAPYLVPGPELPSRLDTSLTFFIHVIISIFADFPPTLPRLIVPPWRTEDGIVTASAAAALASCACICGTSCSRVRAVDPWCGCSTGFGFDMRGARTSARIPRWPMGAETVGRQVLPSGATLKDWSLPLVERIRLWVGGFLGTCLTFCERVRIGWDGMEIDVPASSLRQQARTGVYGPWTR